MPQHKSDRSEAVLDLSRLLSPAAIALVGASSNPKAIGGQPLRYMKEFGYRGKLYPVNPNRKEVQGLTCYDSALSIPEPCDVAVITVPAAQVPGVIRDCGTAHIPFAVVLSAGFQDAGAAGAELQGVLQQSIIETGVRVVGPNSTGVVNLLCRSYCGQGGALSDPGLQAGSVAIVSQSGGVGLGVLAYVQGSGIGTNYFVSSGNEVDLNVFDFVAYLLAAPEVSRLVLYLESSVEGRRLRALGRRALKLGKPIVVMKAGNSGTARKAATSHTGRLTADYELFRTAFREGGYIEVNELDELVNVLTMLQSRKPIHGKRAAILTTSGGWGVMMAERCEQHGLKLPALAAETLAEIRKVAPSHASLVNPVDVTPQGYGEQYAALDVMAHSLLADPGIDMLVVRSATGGDVAAWADHVIRVAERCDKPIVVNWAPAPGRYAEARRVLESRGIACVSYAGPLAQAAAACADFALKRARLQFVSQQSSQPVHPPALNLRLRDSPGTMGEHASKQCLQTYSIPVTHELLVSLDQLDAMDWRALEFPVAVKVVSSDLPHKTEAGGVALDLKNADEVANAVRLVLDNARAYAPQAVLDGVLAQRMASGLEVILGAVADPHFGPYVMLGMGGIFTEVVRDVTYRYAPVSNDVALEMIREVRSSRMFDGVRGQPARDVNALAGAIVNLSRLIWDHQQRIAEIEINPLFVGAVGAGVVAADCLISVK